MMQKNAIFDTLIGDPVSHELDAYRLLPFVLRRAPYSKDKVSMSVRDFHLVDFAGDARLQDMLAGKKVTLTDKDLESMFQTMFHDTRGLFRTTTTCESTSARLLDKDDYHYVEIEPPVLGTWRETFGEKEVHPNPCRLFEISDGKHTMFLPLSDHVTLKSTRFKVSEPISWRFYAEKLPKLDFEDVSGSKVARMRAWRLTVDEKLDKADKAKRASQMVLQARRDRRELSFGKTPDLDVIGLLAQHYVRYVPERDTAYGHFKAYYDRDTFYSPISLDPSDPRAKQLQEGKMITVTADDMKQFFDDKKQFLATEEFPERNAGSFTAPEGTQIFTLRDANMSEKDKKKGLGVTLLLPKNVHLDAESLLEKGFTVTPRTPDYGGIILNDSGDEKPKKIPSILPRIHKAWDEYYGARREKAKRTAANAALAVRLAKDHAAKQTKNPEKRRVIARSLIREAKARRDEMKQQ